ncbi:hypothetical protein JXH92_003675 [Salmonella enterica subsp. enterica serovar 4,[5],12:b:-]|nr:hypothetical protein [Salmonella enterica subsp. enterica serovar 4,[5],12:b:-]
MSDNMYYDPKEFDFTDLKDIVSTTQDDLQGRNYSDNEITPRTSQTLEEIYEADPFNPANHFLKEEEKESNPNEDVSDLTANENAKEQAELNEIFNNLPDESELEIGGVRLSKAQIKDLYVAKNKVDIEKQYIDQFVTNFNEGNQYIQKQLNLKATAIDLNIQRLENALNKPGISSTEYGETARMLREAYAAQADLHNLADEQWKIRHQQEQQATLYRINQADTAMINEYGEQWNHWKQAVVNDAQSRGIDLSQLEKVWSKELAQTLLESLMFRQNKAKFAEKAKQLVAAKSRSSSNSAARTLSEANDLKREKTLRAARSGVADPDTNRDLFKYLKD